VLPRRTTLITLVATLVIGGAAAAPAVPPGGGTGPSASTGPSAATGPSGATTAPASVVAKMRAAFRPFARNSGVYVVDLDTGRVLFSENATSRRYPASVEKLYTLTTALALFGVNGTLRTEVYGAGTLEPDGVFNGNLYLRGGGDPTFGDAKFIHDWYGGIGTSVGSVAAKLIAATHIKRVTGSVIGDESYFDAQRGDPASNYLPDPNLVGELSALSFDRGAVGTQSSPAAHAAWELAGSLRHAGVPVSGPSQAGTTPPGAQLLLTVDSPTMSQLAALTAGPSDDFFAEMILKALGARFGTGGTTLAGASVVRHYLAGLELTPAITDGSGLSREDLTTPLQVVTLLRDLSPGGDGDLQGVGAALRAALPVVGRSGTLAGRMIGTAAAGNCEAKSGTLSDASDLAGWCDNRFAFAILMNHVAVWRAQQAEDRIVTPLAALVPPGARSRRPSGG
jgi:D-alanyl-D-alanine carboxypeptidase/D-alanyl-D-alanine-endopeptidase (penicillin-binding protein 4)